MNLYKHIRWLACSCLYMSVPGCVGWFMPGSTQGLGYVLAKGNSENIAKWTMKQTDGSKIYDGLMALKLKVAEDTDNKAKAESEIDWCVITFNKLEDWPPDYVLAPDDGDHFTIGALLQQMFSYIAFDAYRNSALEELLQRLRPNESHAQWLPIWEKGSHEIDGSQQNPPSTAPEN